MEPSEALSILAKYLDTATKRGAFQLEQVSTIIKAINTFKNTTSDLTPQEALVIMVNGLDVATKAGSFGLEEVELILKAIGIFRQQPQTELPQETEPVKTKTPIVTI